MDMRLSQIMSLNRIIWALDAPSNEFSVNSRTTTACSTDMNACGGQINSSTAFVPLKQPNGSHGVSHPEPAVLLKNRVANSGLIADGGQIVLCFHGLTTCLES